MLLNTDKNNYYFSLFKLINIRMFQDKYKKLVIVVDDCEIYFKMRYQI